jgi:NADPH:quinone reductase-like Zn-dependent oxidoreductase
MKAYHLDGFGDDLASLHLRDDPMPVASPGQVVVRMRAASLNYRDLVVARGQHPGVSAGVIPLSDGAGQVTAVGEGVYRVKIGERVIPSFNQTWLSGPVEADSLRGMLGGFVDGVLAQYVLLDQQGLVHLPDYLSFEEAATLPCAAVTAWTSLTCGAALRPGHIVLVQGSGGVSIFALQLAKLFSARVIATTSSEKKAQQLRALGAENVVNYSETPRWGAAVRALTGGRGVNRIVEVGGPETLEQSLSCAAAGAQIALVGYVGGLGATINPRLLMTGQISTHAAAVGSRADLANMLSAIDAAQLRPVIDRVFAFEQAVEGYRHLEARNHFGKVVIAIN